jgi:hypothetical protein
MVGFRDSVTGDESWFLQHYNHRQSWCLSADAVAIRVARTTAAQKITHMVFLSIHGAIFIVWVPPGEKFNSGHFCKKILEPLFQVCRAGAVHIFRDQ